MITTEPRKGLIASILSDQNLGNCSANGISARYPGVVIVGVRGSIRPSNTELREAIAYVNDCVLPRLFTAGDRYAEVELVVRELTGGPYVTAVPVERGTGAGPMMGGAYISTSDSRFSEMLHEIYGDKRSQVGPIPLHDRWEA